MAEISAKYKTVGDDDEDEADDDDANVPPDDHPPRRFGQVRVALQCRLFLTLTLNSRTVPFVISIILASYNGVMLSSWTSGVFDLVCTSVASLKPMPVNCHF